MGCRYESFIPFGSRNNRRGSIIEACRCTVLIELARRALSLGQWVAQRDRGGGRCSRKCSIRIESVDHDSCTKQCFFSIKVLQMFDDWSF
jgi:hypothetical protein